MSYTPDAADRIQAITNVATSVNYATLTYMAPGGVNTMTLGNGITETVTWNERAQPITMQATTTSSGANLLKLDFFPCPLSQTSCSPNNGTLRSQKITVPGLSALTQSYSYDSLNRLTQATESPGAGWSQGYGYYGPGNRYVTTNTNLPSLSLETPSAASWYSTAAVPNQIAGWTYDASGNVTAVGSMSRTFTYDAENRQVSATISGTTYNYAYDGEGSRVSTTENGANDGAGL